MESKVSSDDGICWNSRRDAKQKPFLSLFPPTVLVWSLRLWKNFTVAAMAGLTASFWHCACCGQVPTGHLPPAWSQQNSSLQQPWQETDERM